MNISATLLLHVTIVLALSAGWRATGRPVAWRPLLLGLVLVALYWLVSPLGSRVQPLLSGLAALRWNWLGKLFAIAAALLFWRVATDLDRGEIGLTWRQRAGSLIPAAAVVVLACAFAWVDEARLADGTDRSTERLLYQAIMPGLDEELVFRGLLLALFARAFGAGRPIAGAPFGIAGALVTLVFAAGHGLFVTASGGVTADGHALLVTGALGAAFVWLRTRTGSLVAPLIAHNLVNFGNSFF